VKLPTQAEVEVLAADFKTDVTKLPITEVKEAQSELAAFTNTALKSDSFIQILYTLTNNPTVATFFVVMSYFGYKLRDSMLASAEADDLEKILQ
jgi:hypothetical protein